MMIFSFIGPSTFQRWLFRTVTLLALALMFGSLLVRQFLWHGPFDDSSSIGPSAFYFWLFRTVILLAFSLVVLLVR